MTRGRFGSAVLLALCLAVVARADDGGRAGVAPQGGQAEVFEAAKAVQRTYLIRVERIAEARKAAKRAKETDRLAQIDESLKRLEDWRDERLKAMREALDSPAAKAEFDRILARVEADEMPLVSQADAEPAKDDAPAANSEQVEPAEPAAKAAEVVSPVRRTADPHNLRSRLRYNGGKINVSNGSIRASAPPVEAAPEAEDAATGDQPGKDAAEQPKRNGPTTVRRTAKGISVTVSNQSGRMDNAVHGKK